MTRQQQEQQHYFYQVQKESERVLDMRATMLIRKLVVDLASRLEEIVDYRNRECTYNINVLLALVFVGLLLGENDIKNIEIALKNKPSKVASWLGIAKTALPDIPSDTTLLRALIHTVPIDLITVVTEWAEANIITEADRRHISIDGKASRACTSKINGSIQPPFLLNCFTGRAPLGQLEVGAKTNELGMMPELLQLVTVKGSYVTIDAAGTTAPIMKQIVNAGGHVILPVKGNQANLEEACGAYFNDMFIENPDAIGVFKDLDNGEKLHGRVSYREYFVLSEGVDEVLAGTSFGGIAHSIGMARRVREVVRKDADGNPAAPLRSIETILYIMDSPDISASDFGGFVRNHWNGCEMIHYTLDTEFDEDLSRVRTGYAMQNLSLLRKAVYALLKMVQKLVVNLSVHSLRTILNDCGGIPVSVLRPDQQARAG